MKTGEEKMTFGTELHGEAGEAAAPRFRHEGMAAGLAEPRGPVREFVTIPQDSSPVVNSASGWWSRPGWLVGTLFMGLMVGGAVYVARPAVIDRFAAEPTAVPLHTSPPVLAPAVLPEPEAPAEPLHSRVPAAPSTTPSMALMPQPPPPPPDATAAPLPPLGPKQTSRRPSLASSKPRRPAKPALSIERVSGTQGLSPIDIHIAIDPLREQLRMCHADAIKRGLTDRTFITARLTLRGSTIESIAPASAIPSPLLWHCIRGVLFRAAFKTAPAYAEVTVTLSIGAP